MLTISINLTICIGYACRADKNPYRHDRRADKNPYRHDRRADSQCLKERLRFNFECQQWMKNNSFFPGYRRQF